MKKENSKQKQTGPMVWCGPTIHGAAKQYDTFTDGIPKTLEDAITDHPPLAGLLVPLDAFPGAREALEGNTGRLAALDRMARDYFTKGG